MNRMRQWIAITALAGTLPVSADLLVLKDGRRVEGTYLGGTATQIRFQERGRVAQRYTLSSIDSLTFGPMGGSSSSSAPLRDDRGTAQGAVSDNRYPARTEPDSRYGTRDDRYNTRNDQYRGQSGTSTRAGVRELIPAGTTVTVRTIDAINSNANNAGETFRASIDDPIVVDGRTIVPRGADALVTITRVQQSGRLSGSEEIAVALSEITVNGRRAQVQSSYAEVAAKSRGEQTAKVVGGTAVVGAIIGAIAGGGKGAAIGAASGAAAGAGVQAIRGQRVEIPSESKLDFRLEQPVYVE